MATVLEELVSEEENPEEGPGVGGTTKAGLSLPCQLMQMQTVEQKMVQCLL